MTDRKRANWEIAGLDESPSIDTTGWRRPRSVALEGDELVFEWSDDQRFHARAWQAGEFGQAGYEGWRDRRRRLMSFGIANVYPSREMLLRFAQLAEAPAEKIRVFAARQGALQEQVSDDPAWVTPPLLPERQAVAYWRGISRSFARALDLATPSERTFEQERNLLWLVNGHLFQAGVVDFLTFERGRPRVLHASGGLYGGLAVELLATIARVGLRLCEGCGGDVEPGGRRFCRGCRDTGVPAKIRAQRYRVRKQASPSSP